jgi:hypothetical protein
VPGCFSRANFDAVLGAVVCFRDCGSEMAAQRSGRRTSDINTPIFAISVRLLRAVYGSMLVIARQTFAKIGQVTLTPALWGRADSA